MFCFNVYILATTFDPIERIRNGACVCGEVFFIGLRIWQKQSFAIQWAVVVVVV